MSANDSGSAPRLVVVDAGCAVVDALLVVDASGTAVPGEDPEDLAVGPGPDGERVLWLADVGDNEARRDVVELVAVPEAAVREAVADPSSARAGAEGEPGVRGQRLALRLEGGPADVEAAVASPDGDVVLLVEKTLVSRTSRVWSVPVAALGAGEPVTAPQVAEVVLPGAAVGPAALALTGGALLPGSGGTAATLVLRSYTTAWLWPLEAGPPFEEVVAQALRSEPVGLPAAARTAGGGRRRRRGTGGLVLLSEGRPAPVHDVPVPAGGPPDGARGPGGRLPGPGGHRAGPRGSPRPWSSAAPSWRGPRCWPRRERPGAGATPRGGAGREAPARARRRTLAGPGCPVGPWRGDGRAARGTVARRCT